MIRRLGIRGFKRFQSEELELRSLTILAGRNGSGKTSAIQALLLARHSTQRGDGIAELNGPYGMELGWFEDVVNANAEGPFTVTLVDQEYRSATWTFTKGDTELYARVEQPEKLLPFFSPALGRGFQYLSAERNGPRITQKSAPLPLEMLEVGCRGEHVAQVIEKLGSQMVSKPRQTDSGENEEFALVKGQTERWLSRIVRPVDINTEAFSGTDIVSLSFRNDGDSPWVRPTNMGFGVSYTLPIVVAAMTATEGGLIIVENPEAHLHPAGQSEMGIFLAHMAASDLQVIVETHSDHILNGIRRAIGSERIISAENAIVHYFPDAVSRTKPLNFTTTGGVTEWPAGFFDQYRLDVQRITSVQRPR